MNSDRPQPKQTFPKHAREVFTGIIFSVHQWEQELYDGTVAMFERLKRADTASVIAITEDKKIIITEQEQPGLTPFLSLPGGVVDQGESSFEAAKRELLEETGYRADGFLLWDSVQPSDKIDWAVFTYIAKGCKRVASPHLDAGEKIQLRFVTFDEFVKLVADKRFRDTEVALKILRALPYPEEIEKIKAAFLG